MTTNNSLLNDASGVMPAERRVRGSLNRPSPRELPFSFGSGAAGNSWTRVKAAVITTAASSWKSVWAGYGIDVVWDPQTQRLAMLYGGYNGTTTQTGLAYSDDGIQWTDYGSNPVIVPNPTGSQPDSGAIAGGFPVYLNGTWYIFYIGFPSAGIESGTPSVCLATATSLTGTLTRLGAQLTPSMFPGPAGVTVVYRPTVFQVGTTWYMFTNAGPASGDEDIWYATAPAITGPWTVQGSTPTITAESFSGTALIADPEIVRWGDMFVMIAWSGTSLYVAYCDQNNFPDTWTPNTTPFLTRTGGLYRPCLIRLPSGTPALYVHANNSVQIDVWVPPGAAPQAAQPSKWQVSVLGTSPPFKVVAGTQTQIYTTTMFCNIERYNNSGTINDESWFVVDLSAGTWSLNIGTIKNNASGIATIDISFDGGVTFQAIGTFDNYAASAVASLAQFTAINVPSSGPAIIRFRVLSKNASSSSYFWAWSHLDFVRTA